MTNQFQRSDSVAALLRSAGPRELAPLDRARRVERAARAEWQGLVRQRHRHRLATWITALATVATVALIVLQPWLQPRLQPWQAQPMLTNDPLAAQTGTKSPPRYAAVSEAGQPAAEVPAEDVVPGFSRARMVMRPRRAAPRPGALDAAGPLDGSQPRRILVTYAWESR